MMDKINNECDSNSAQNSVEIITVSLIRSDVSCASLYYIISHITVFFWPNKNFQE